MTATRSTDGDGRSVPGGGGGIRSIGDAFQPNLAMGGGSYRIPFDLPQGPGGMAPKLDLVYSTGLGNGPFGIGWSLSVPFIERKRRSPFVPPGEIEYTLSGAETLVPLQDGRFAPFTQAALQTYAFDGGEWTAMAPNLVQFRFGHTAASRVAESVGDEETVHRWLLDRATFPADRAIDYEYEPDGAGQLIRRIRWSVFRLEFEYEDRPDPWSWFDPGFELRTTKRCRRVALHQDRLSPETLTRTYDLEYAEAPHVSTSLLQKVSVSGWRFEDGALRETALAPLVFGYSAFDPSAHRIERFRSSVVPPPPLGGDTALLDHRGTSLPGVLRMNGIEATYWENRGGLQWGPPERLPALPQGVHLSDDRVRFADLTGNVTADLIVGDLGGGGYYPNDPEQGFLPKRSVSLAPGFDLREPGSWLVDLDGDRVADLLTVRGGAPMAFFNDGGQGWTGPVVLPSDNLPSFVADRSDLRVADMNGDGLADLVQVRSRQITYWPYLGTGRWGEPRVMEGTPEFDVPRGDTDVLLTDVDGDGTADLVLVGNGSVRVYLNAGGEAFGPPIVLDRTPVFGADLALADMTGSGTIGLLWTSEGAGGRGHDYWYLDLMAGVKPYLMTSIDNGMGLATSIEYSSSSAERSLDLADGRRWSGYLPFPVQVVKRITVEDAVTGQRSETDYRYHDGHYDGMAREYLGFAQVDSRRLPTPHEDEVVQRLWFHNRNTSGDDPSFIAGKGQPRRTEVVDAATNEVRRRDESTWVASLVAGSTALRPAYLALEKVRASERIEAGVAFEAERIEFDHDAAGNVVKETRRGEWTDSSGSPVVDQLVIETTPAEHASQGATSFPARIRKRTGAGRVLSDVRFFYDGPAFQGLPFGEVERGWKTRQTEVVLTTDDVADAYGASPPALLGSLYRTEQDPDIGDVLVLDAQRYRLDEFGNQLETIDELGGQTTIAYDPDDIHPVSVSSGAGPARTMEYDPIAQQLAAAEDPNGNVVRTRYDGLGNIVEVARRGAQPGMPTEVYEYVRSSVPNVVIQRVRIDHALAEPGWVQHRYLDGSGRTAQLRTLAEDGRWAVGKREVLTPEGRAVVEHDAYFSATPNFEADPPAGTLSRELRFDFAARVVEERLFGGGTTRYRYVGNEARFYDPRDTVAFDSDPSTPPSRISRNSAWGKLVAIVERDDEGTYEERREYDALGRLARIIDPMGHVALESAFDARDRRIRVRSAESGLTTFVFDAAGHEVLRTDADGRSVFHGYDDSGRQIEVRRDGPAGPVEERFSYDTGDGDNLVGRLAKVEGTFGTAEYSYSMDGDPVRIRRSYPADPTVYEIGFSFNAQRKVTEVRYPDGTSVEYRYHPTGLLESIPGYVDDVGCGPTGKRERIAYANGLETRRTFTPGEYLLQEIITEPTAGGPAFQRLVHHLDELGQVTRIEDLSTVTGKVRNNQTYRYDHRNRLTTATGRGPGGPYEFDYRYDALGNLVFSGESFAEDMDYGHHVGDADHPNRLIKRKAAGSPEYTYDASGNMTGDPDVGTLAYDARHRLVRVDRPDGTVVEYVYDHDDRRVESRVASGGGTEIRREIESLYLVEMGGGSTAGATTKVVFDEDHRLAVVPSTGDALLHHLDRLGNVNVVSNLGTGAFVGNNEFTPYGALSIAISIEPNFSFQGARFSDGLDMVLLGLRFYRHALGRFITPDGYLLVEQEKINGIVAATNLYLYALGNPVNFTDPNGTFAFLAVLLAAVIIGAILGTIGAAVAGAQTWDEWLLWIVGGMIGGALVALTGGGLGLLIGGTAAAAGLGATVAVTIWAIGSLLGTILTPILDNSNSGAAWFFSFLLKWIQSPVTTTIGLIAALIVWIGGGKVDFRRGMLFIEVGSGGGALTLGAVAWTQSGRFDASGNVSDNLARHESYHSRTVVALGELGFYFTYVTVGAIWGVAQGGAWNSLSAAGCGNPFEKTAHTFTGDPAVASAC